MWLPDGTALTAFVFASLVLALMPGPGVFYIVTRSLGQGRAAGMRSVLGVALGNLLNALAAAFGLAALFAVSSLAFEAVRLVGAAYLIYLGLRILTARGKSVGPDQVQPSRQVFVDGLVVALFNPKTTLFFAAFLPQFMSASIPAMPQAIALGTLFTLIALVTDSLYALAASWVSGKLSKQSHVMNVGRKGYGLALLGLGVWAAVTGERGKAIHN